jgi:hypothetical protein
MSDCSLRLQPQLLHSVDLCYHLCDVASLTARARARDHVCPRSPEHAIKRSQRSSLRLSHAAWHCVPKPRDSPRSCWSATNETTCLFSASCKNRRLQNLPHSSCALSGCCQPTPRRSRSFPAGRDRRPALPLTLVRAQWNPRKKCNVYDTVSKV